MFQIDWQILNVILLLVTGFGAAIVFLFKANASRDEKYARLEGYIDGLRTNKTIMPVLEGAYDNSKYYSKFPITAAKSIAEVISEANIPGVDGFADSVYNLLIEVTDGVPVVKKVEAVKAALEETSKE